MLVLLSLFVAACGTREEDTDPEGLPPDTDVDDSCSEDDDCGDGEICEGSTCEDGDRNNSTEEAEGLFWGNLVEGEINPEGDVDWYAVAAEGGEFFRISVVTAESEDGINSVVSVYTEGGKRLVWEDAHPAGNVSSADSMCFGYFPDAGTYYIKVEDLGTFEGTSPIGGDGESYTLEIAEWSSVGVEPDSAMEAGLDFGAVNVNTLYSFPVLLDEAGDVDWAAFDLPEAGSPVYFVALEHADESEVAPVAMLKNEAGEDVLYKELPTGAEPGLLPNPLGTRYVLGATDAAGGGGADYWTWLFFIVREAGSGNQAETEPNDTVEAPEAVTLEDQEPDSGEFWSAYRQGAITSDTDADLYAFEVPFDDAYVSVYIGAEPYGSLLVPRLELLDAAGTVLDTVDSSESADRNALNMGPYPAGTYVLRVSPLPESEAVGGEGFFYMFGLFASSSQLD